MRERVVVAVLVGMLTMGAASWAAAAEPAAGQEIRSVMAGRMVCSDACQGRLDLANGLKKCANCDQRCNIANKYCPACAMKLGVCEVCGKQMRAAATGPAAAAKPAEGEVAAVVAGNTSFACDLYQRLSAEQGNLFLSPYSISTALAMTYAGAAGTTATQMAAVMHFDVPQATLHPAFQSLAAELTGGAEKKAYELSVANALWGQKDYKFLDAFLQTCRTNYGGGLRTVDFAGATEAARGTINAWAEKETHDKIKELLKPGILTSLTRLVLTNAIYFKGQWETAFDKKQTQDAPFTLAVPAASREKAPTVTVPMMHRKGQMKFWETDGLQVLELPYKGGDLSMVILLPVEPKERLRAPLNPWRLESHAAFERSITAERLNQWLRAMRLQEVDVFLPRFTVTSEFSLAETLKAMGMKDAFTTDADFSGMDGTKALYISAVVHKAFVDVAEEGTEAAAATAVVMAVKGAPQEAPVFRADHPFVFLIRHMKTGSILFMGRVMNPKA